MTQDEHDRNACAKSAGHGFDVFDFDPLEDLVRRHSHQFCAAKQISAKALKMPAHKAAQFARRLFIGKRNSNIALCQAPIFPGKDPGTKAKELAKSKQKPQWQRGGNGRPRAIKKVNDKVEHCGTGNIAGVARQGRFACGLLQPI